jgi:hypothetical protein
MAPVPPRGAISPLKCIRNCLVYTFSHSPILPFSHSPILPFSHSPILPFSPSLLLRRKDNLFLIFEITFI